MTTYRSSNGLTVQSDLTAAEALDLLRRSPSDFARDLARKAAETYLHGPRRGQRVGLSESQWAWAHKLALEQQAREEAPAAPAAAAPGPAADFEKVMALFAAASAAGRKFPKLRFAMQGKVIVLSLCGAKSKTPGAVNVTDGRKYPDNVWYGRVAQDGRFFASQRTRPETGLVLAFLRELAADPVKAAAEYGRRAGECCFCGKELTVSTVGYGPDCAKVWGLPYDSLTRQERRTASARRAAAAEAPSRRPAAVETTCDAPRQLEEFDRDAGEEAMNAAFARAEREAEERGFMSDPDFRAAAETPPAAQANADGSWSAAALLAALRRNG